MKVLIGISHPKQVYMFKNLIYTLIKNGHEYFVVVNEKEITSALLEEMDISFKVIGTNKKNS
jgi:predicted glycosyltransferase